MRDGPASLTGTGFGLSEKRERHMTKHKKGTGKPKAGILRPWLVDVPVDQLR
jgi:hypothetical protein